ncbi:hypothetical protein RIF29_14124 [Crotalaria pallida]|uniref:Uncharacterized protein n=1 Tax=Crotalaria pallida TaxID=3830 RepID=A0AAN9FJH4_CROPI
MGGSFLLLATFPRVRGGSDQDSALPLFSGKTPCSRTPKKVGSMGSIELAWMSDWTSGEGQERTPLGWLSGKGSLLLSGEGRKRRYGEPGEPDRELPLNALTPLERLKASSESKPAYNPRVRVGSARFTVGPGLPDS